ncbi:hypothetical protein ACQEU6_39705 [Spirillospora sp. CA-108201]
MASHVISEQEATMRRQVTVKSDGDFVVEVDTTIQPPTLRHSQDARQLASEVVSRSLAAANISPESATVDGVTVVPTSSGGSTLRATGTSSR